MPTCFNFTRESSYFFTSIVFSSYLHDFLQGFRGLICKHLPGVVSRLLSYYSHYVTVPRKKKNVFIQRNIKNRSFVFVWCTWRWTWGRSQARMCFSGSDCVRVQNWTELNCAWRWGCSDCCLRGCPDHPEPCQTVRSGCCTSPCAGEGVYYLKPASFHWWSSWARARGRADFTARSSRGSDADFSPLLSSTCPLLNPVGFLSWSYLTLCCLVSCFPLNRI